MDFSKLWFSFIKANPKWNWDWDTLISNPNVNWDIIQSDRWEDWKEKFERIIARTAAFKQELLACTGQNGWYFRSCITKELINEEEHSYDWSAVKDWHIDFPVKFRGF